MIAISSRRDKIKQKLMFIAMSLLLVLGLISFTIPTAASPSVVYKSDEGAGQTKALSNGGSISFGGVYESPSGSGSLHVTSMPDGASFTLSGAANYSDTTPFNKIAAPAGEYTITWHYMPGRITPLPETKVLSDGKSMTFSGIYLIATGKGTINVTSTPAGASFTLSGAANYSGTTPWSRSDAPVGSYYISWNNIGGYNTPSGQTKTLTDRGNISFDGNYISEHHEAPNITSIEPNYSSQGETLGVTITGTNFTGATDLSFGTGIDVDYTVNSATRITATITIGAHATSGSRDVTVTTPGGIDTLAGGFFLLGANDELLGMCTYNSEIYYVYGDLPQGDSIKILDADHTLVTDPATAESVLEQIAWVEAAVQLNASDVETLEEVLTVSGEIYSEVSLVIVDTEFVINRTHWLETYNYLGVSAWDPVQAECPEIETLDSTLRALDEELEDLQSASQTLNEDLTDVTGGLEDLEAGSPPDPQLASDIENAVSEFEALDSKTKEIQTSLSDVSNMLSSLESCIWSIEDMPEDTPQVCNVIYEFAGYIGDLDDSLSSLNSDLQDFSSSLATQSDTIEKLKSTAESEADELYELWIKGGNGDGGGGGDGGEGLPIWVWLVVVFGGLVVLVIVGSAIITKRRRITENSGRKQ